jgi:hypothetical protein
MHQCHPLSSCEYLKLQLADQVEVYVLFFQFMPLDGSVESVQHYLKGVATRGWLEMAEMSQEEQMRMNATKVRTHNPLDGEWEHDEVRFRDEIRRADR